MMLRTISTESLVVNHVVKCNAMSAVAAQVRSDLSIVMECAIVFMSAFSDEPQ